MALLGLRCFASYATGKPKTERACEGPAVTLRHQPVDEHWSVTVPLCKPHAELWDGTAHERPKTLGTADARG